MTKSQIKNFTDKYCPSIYNAINKKGAIKLTKKEIEKVNKWMYEIRELLLNGCGLQTSIDTAIDNWNNAVKDYLKRVKEDISK